MLLVSIKDKNKLWELYTNKVNNKYQFYGYYYDEIGKKKITKDFFQYIKLLSLSKNNRKIDDTTYEDLDTGFIHSIRDGKEDLEFFYLHNGCNALLYEGASLLLTPKKFTLKNVGVTLIFASFFSMLFVVGNASSLESSEVVEENDGTYIADTPTLTLVELYNALNTSPYLNKEEKEFLYNEEFLSDLLPYVYSTASLNYQLLNHYNNLNIQTFEVTSSTLGYYNPIHYNSIYIGDYNKEQLNNYKDTLAHEFVHLNQASYDYVFLNEVSAEVISYEYFAGTKMNTYKEGTNELKILMEIIGPELVWKYNFSGDFTGIEEVLNTYLESSEVEEIKSIFKTSPSDIKNYTRLNTLLNKIYYGMHKKNMEEDPVISSYLNGNDLTRYYFNARKMQEETITVESTTPTTYTLKEAYQEGLLEFYKYKKVDVENKSDIPTDKEVLVNYKVDKEDSNNVKVNYYYIDDEKLSLEEYLENKENPDYYIKVKNNYKYNLSDNTISIYIKNVTIEPISKISVVKGM